MVSELKDILDNRYRNDYQLDVIEVAKSPELVLDEDDVVATPTLVKYEPPPIKRIIGDVSRADLIAGFLVN